MTIVVGYAPGGGSDLWARSIAGAASEVLGVPVTVTNIVGEGGLDALDAFMDMPADGCTLMSIVDVYASAFAEGLTAIDPATDITPLIVGNIVVSQMYIAPDDPRYSSWDEVVAYARRNPSLRVASAGAPRDPGGVERRGA